MVANNEWLLARLGQGFFESWHMYLWRDLGKRLVQLSFYIWGLSFQTNLFNCEVDPLSLFTTASSHIKENTWVMFNDRKKMHGQQLPPIHCQDFGKNYSGGFLTQIWSTLFIPTVNSKRQQLDSFNLESMFGYVLSFYSSLSPSMLISLLHRNITHQNFLQFPNSSSWLLILWPIFLIYPKASTAVASYFAFALVHLATSQRKDITALFLSSTMPMPCPSMPSQSSFPSFGPTVFEFGLPRWSLSSPQRASPPAWQSTSMLCRPCWSRRPTGSLLSCRVHQWKILPGVEEQVDQHVQPKQLPAFGATHPPKSSCPCQLKTSPQSVTPACTLLPTATVTASTMTGWEPRLGFAVARAVAEAFPHWHSREGQCFPSQVDFQSCYCFFRWPAASLDRLGGRGWFLCLSPLSSSSPP